MQVNLVFLKKDGTNSSFSLPSTVTFIGRRQDCDFCIPLMVVSRRHCEINMDFGKITVRDMKSCNGTLVNGNPIEEAQLKAGDVLQIGPVKFVVQVDGIPENFEEYLSKKEESAEQAPETESSTAEPVATPSEPPTPAAETEEKKEEDLDKMLEGLPEADLSKSQTELASGLMDDFDFDEDFDL